MLIDVLYRKMSVFRKLDLSFNASLWLLYSITVSAGKLSTFLIVSLQVNRYMSHAIQLYSYLSYIPDLQIDSGIG